MPARRLAASCQDVGICTTEKAWLVPQFKGMVASISRFVAGLGGAQAAAKANILVAFQQQALGANAATTMMVALLVSGQDKPQSSIWAQCCLPVPGPPAGAEADQDMHFPHECDLAYDDRPDGSGRQRMLLKFHTHRQVAAALLGGAEPRASWTARRLDFTLPGAQLAFVLRQLQVLFPTL